MQTDAIAASIRATLLMENFLPISRAPPLPSKHFSNRDKIYIGGKIDSHRRHRLGHQTLTVKFAL